MIAMSWVLTIWVMSKPRDGLPEQRPASRGIDQESLAGFGAGER